MPSGNSDGRYFSSFLLHYNNLFIQKPVVKARDEAAELLERALYTATVESRESAAGKLLHDSRKVIEETFQWLIGAIIRPLVMDQLSPIIEAVVGPLKELIPEDLQDFVDPVASLEELAEHSEYSCIFFKIAYLL